MPLRFAVTRQLGTGEQVVVDVCQWNPVTGDIVHDNVDQMATLLDKAFTFVDERAIEIYLRVFEIHKLRDYFAPEEWMKVASVLDIIAGRVDIEMVIHRWNAIKEENQALEDGRLEAMQKALNDQDY